MNKKIIALSGITASLFMAVTNVYAAGIDPGTPGGTDVTKVQVGKAIGTVADLADAFRFVSNLMSKIGWAGVIVGITIILALLVYRLISADDTEAMKTVQGGITKAILIVIIGLLLISAGFIIKTVTGLFGYDDANPVPGYVPSELDTSGASGECSTAGYEKLSHKVCDGNLCVDSAPVCVDPNNNTDDCQDNSGCT